jgi:hypothetical protein
MNEESKQAVWMWVRVRVWGAVTRPRRVPARRSLEVGGAFLAVQISACNGREGGFVGGWVWRESVHAGRGTGRETTGDDVVDNNGRAAWHACPRAAACSRMAHSSRYKLAPGVRRRGFCGKSGTIAWGHEGIMG